MKPMKKMRRGPAMSGASSYKSAIVPAPASPSATHDVMAGPVSTFVPQTPVNLLMRPGLGLGTRMG